MSETDDVSRNLPQAKTRAPPRSFSLIWLVPLAAALVAIYLVYQHLREFGPTITIKFRDVTGLKPGQSALQYRGTDIGQVTAVALSNDRQSASVKIKLRRQAEPVACAGSVFWIVRPQLGMGNITGLGTLITGPYIEVLPGGGARTAEFTGIDRSAMMIDPHGLTVVLHADHSGSLRAGVPLYYRGIEVGAVRETQLSTNSATGEIQCVIRQRYAPLVRAETKFWNVTGLDVRVGLFRGAEVNVESLKSLFIGGIAFATPKNVSAGPVVAGTLFSLHDKPEKEWLNWAPNIFLPPHEALLDPAEAAERQIEIPPRPLP